MHCGGASGGGGAGADEDAGHWGRSEWHSKDAGGGGRCMGSVHRTHACTHTQNTQSTHKTHTQSAHVFQV